MGRGVRAAADKSHVITRDTIPVTLLMATNKHGHQQTQLQVRNCFVSIHFVEQELLATPHDVDLIQIDEIRQQEVGWLVTICC
jgi:hypothetical protein